MVRKSRLAWTGLLLLFWGAAWVFAIRPAGAANAVRKIDRAPAAVKISREGVKLVGHPDLKVTQVAITPPHPRVSKDIITIKVTVKNRGKAPTSAKCHLTMSVYSVDASGMQIPGNSLMGAIPGYTNNIPVLGPGASCQISKTVTLHHAGRNAVSGVINTEFLQVGEESDTQNNTYKQYFEVSPKPAPADLVLHGIMLTSGGRIKIKMSNAGKAIPDYDFDHAWVKAEVIGSDYKQIHLKDMDPNGLLKKPGVPLGMPGAIRVNYIWPATGPQGIALSPGNTYQVKVVLDCFPRITDSNRANNTKTVILRP
jgi:hypothetical protein